MKKNIFKSLVASALLVLGACETTELDLLENPNAVGPDNADVGLLLNGAIQNFRNFTAIQTDRPMQVTRMVHMFGPTYDNGVTPETFNGLWSSGYAGVLPDAEAVITKGADLELWEHVGIAKIIKSYTISTLVDFFGDVPYTEALQFTDNLNPAPDDDELIYASAITLLDEAIADLAKTSPTGYKPADDIFYGGDAAKWTTLAKTLKLRLLNNSRLVDTPAKVAAMNALIAEDDLIDTAAEEWEVAYGTQDNDPDVRHFKFTAGYLGDGGEYMSNSFMDEMYNGKTDPDPRIRYYFYRQSLTYPDPSTPEGLFTLPCLAENKPAHYTFSDVFCTVGDGYWGRDHMNDDGGPPDGNKITLWGLYPAGGKFDNNNGSPGTATDGAKGAGINPLWTAAMTKFLLAEAAHEAGTTGDPKALLEEGILFSMAKVVNFQSNAVPAGAGATVAEISSYISEVITNYDNAASPESRLNIIMTEAFIAAWGNGLEVYNAYRRTGLPADPQPAISGDNAGTFIHSFPYPANTINRNQNMSPKADYGVRVFWDKRTGEALK
ncbi:MAG: SusD/RagB family nutrient-binding outer membrane lipoprotein [Flavobacteriaceae bacterium]|nr:SusD/RagB family nutrient-binding outer membrane lipoprotein [Flavobacteriaceae bacterium]